MEVLNKITLEDIRNKQPEWFSIKNKRFFGDINYWLKYSKSNKPYLVRSTYAWSDVFGNKKEKNYTINEINEDLKIGCLIMDKDYLHFKFPDMNSVEAWLNNN